MRTRPLRRFLAVALATLFAVGAVTAPAAPAAAAMPGATVAADVLDVGVQNHPHITNFSCESGDGFIACFLSVSGTYTSIQWYLVRNGSASPIASDTTSVGIGCTTGDRVRVDVANGSDVATATSSRRCTSNPWL